MPKKPRTKLKKQPAKTGLNKMRSHADQYIGMKKTSRNLGKSNHGRRGSGRGR